MHCCPLGVMPPKWKDEEGTVLSQPQSKHCSCASKAPALQTGAKPEPHPPKIQWDSNECWTDCLNICNKTSLGLGNVTSSEHLGEVWSLPHYHVTVPALQVTTAAWKLCKIWHLILCVLLFMCPPSLNFVLCAYVISSSHEWKRITLYGVGQFYCVYCILKVHTNSVSRIW